MIWKRIFSIGHDYEFQPEKKPWSCYANVEKLEKFGYKIIRNGDSEVCFNKHSCNG